MWTWILPLMRGAGLPSIGYFINDLSRWVNGLLPSSIQNRTKGGTAWWFIALLIVIITGLFFFVIRLLTPRGKKQKGLFVLLAATTVVLYSIDSYFGLGGDGIVMATSLITLTT